MSWASQRKRIQRFLRDPDEKIWDDALLLRFFNDEQHIIQNRLLVVQDLKVTKIPPEFQSSYMYDWEWPFTDFEDGEVFQMGFYSDAFDCVCLYYWEG